MLWLQNLYVHLEFWNKSIKIQSNVGEAWCNTASLCFSYRSNSGQIYSLNSKIYINMMNFEASNRSLYIYTQSTHWLTHWLADSVHIMLLGTWKRWNNMGMEVQKQSTGITARTWWESPTRREKKIRTRSLAEAKLGQFCYGFIWHPQV